MRPFLWLLGRKAFHPLRHLHGLDILGAALTGRFCHLVFAHELRLSLQVFLVFAFLRSLLARLLLFDLCLQGCLHRLFLRLLLLLQNDSFVSPGEDAPARLQHLINSLDDLLARADVFPRDRVDQVALYRAATAAPGLPGDGPDFERRRRVDALQLRLGGTQSDDLVRNQVSHVRGRFSRNCGRRRLCSLGQALLLVDHHYLRCAFD